MPPGAALFPLLLLAYMIVAAILFAACGVANQVPGLSRRPQVMVSFYPLFEIARRIGADRVEVVNLVPPGAEPHDFELTPGDIRRLRSAALVVHLGVEGFQPAMDEVVPQLTGDRPVVVDVANSAKIEEGPAEEGDKMEPDPHIWLDPALMKDVAARIRDGLAQVDPAGQEVYATNTRALLVDLDQLDQDFRSGLASCQQREIVTSHAAFGYLSRRYGLSQVALAGISPEAEPTPRHLQEVAALVRSRGAKIVFVEPLGDPKVAETIAREVGVKTAPLDPVEGLTKEQSAQGLDYFKIMRQNLQQLRAALECQ